MPFQKRKRKASRGGSDLKYGSDLKSVGKEVLSCGSDTKSVGKEVVSCGSDTKSVGKEVRGSDANLKPLGKLLGRRKRKRKQKAVVKEPPYKVLFPGYRGGASTLKDPRLGDAQRTREAFFAEQHRIYGSSHFGDYDGTSEVGSDTESEREDYSNVPTTVVKVCVDKPIIFPKLSEAEKAAMAERWELFHKRFYRRAVRNEAQMLKERDCKCAEAAMNFYNKKHDTQYEIVETLGSYSSVSIGFWYHCNFRAECKSGTGLGHPKLFFAELNRTSPKELDVIDCMILDDPGYCVNTTRGCKMCSGPLLHPIKGFQVGK